MAEDNGSGINLKVLIILMVVMIIVTGVFSYVFMSYFAGNLNNNQEKETVKEEEEEKGPTYTLGEYVVNLAGSGGYQFIKANIVVEVDDKKVISELEKRSPQIRDTIIIILREQQIEDIEDPKAEIIKTQLLTRINKILNSGKIEHVWFTQFVVQ